MSTIGSEVVYYLDLYPNICLKTVAHHQQIEALKLPIGQPLPTFLFDEHNVILSIEDISTFPMFGKVTSIFLDSSSIILKIPNLFFFILSMVFFSGILSSLNHWQSLTRLCLLPYNYHIGMLSGLQVVLARQHSQVWLMPTPMLSQQESPVTGRECTTTCQS